MEGLGKELKLFDSYLDVHDIQHGYQNRSKTSAVSARKLNEYGESRDQGLSLSSTFLCYVDPQLIEEFIQRRGSETLWNTARLREYAGTYVVCQAITVTVIQPQDGDNMFFNTPDKVYEVERFATDDAGIKMQLIGLRRRYCLPSSVLRLHGNSRPPGGRSWQLTEIDDHILVNQNHWVPASRIAFEEEEGDPDKYMLIEDEYYTRDAVESNTIENIVWDHYNEEYRNSEGEDMFYGYVSRNEEGWFSRIDYCYSDTGDIYFMDNYVAEDMNYEWCESRGTYVHYEDRYDDEEEDEITIKNYSYRPEFFYTEKDRMAYSPRDIGKRTCISSYGGGYASKGSDNYLSQSNTQIKYLGIELEVEPKINYDTCAEATIDNLGDRAYCKSDSSVSGYEIVTHPVTYEFAKSMSWRDTLKDMRKRGTTSYKSGRCGVHVHVNKLSLNKFQWASVIMFMDMYKREVKAISQRSTATLDRWSRIRGVRHYFGTTSANKNNSLVDLIKYGRLHSSERYSAINTQNNRTVEFRLFRGTTKYESFIAYIEFVDCLTEFVKQYSTTLVLREYLAYQRDMSQGDVCLWKLFCVFAQVKQYKYLCDMLDRKHINV